MDEGNDFDRFVAAMPRTMEPQFRDGDAGSTAFWSARRAGWELDVLVHDSLGRIRRGGEFGVLVQRLTTLGQHRPTDPKDRPTSKRQPAPYVNTQRPDVPPSWIAERRQLVRTITREKIPPAEAEKMMQELTDRQKGTLSS